MRQKYQTPGNDAIFFRKINNRTQHLVEFEQKLEVLLPRPFPKRLAVGVSGGADSLCLAFLLSLWGKKHSVEIFALTVDHRLRVESAVEAKFVTEQVSPWGLKPAILPLKDPPSKRIQEKAREKRSAAMALFCHDHEIPVLLLAHHQEDQLETFCMRLGAGSGLFGLAAMLPVTRTQGLHLVRPLLDVPQKILKAILRAHQISWVEDPSNQNPSFLRVRTRGFLSSFSPEERHFWMVELGRLNQQRQVHEKVCDEFLSLYCRWAEAGTAVIELDEFLALNQEIQHRLLGKLLGRVGGVSPHPLSQASRRRVLEDLSQSSFRAATLGGCVLRKMKRELFIVREWQRIAPVLLDDERRSFLWDGRFYLAFQEGVSLKGLSLRPRGKQNEILENKGSPEALAALPALFRGETPLWPSENGIPLLRTLKWL